MMLDVVIIIYITEYVDIHITLLCCILPRAEMVPKGTSPNQLLLPLEEGSIRRTKLQSRKEKKQMECEPFNYSVYHYHLLNFKLFHIQLPGPRPMVLTPGYAIDMHEAYWWCQTRKLRSINCYTVMTQYAAILK